MACLARNGGHDSRGLGRVWWNEQRPRCRLGPENWRTSVSWTAIEFARVVSASPAPKMSKENILVPGGVVPGTGGDSGRCRCGSRLTVQTDPLHRRCLLEAWSVRVPADVSQADSLEGRALDDDTEPGFQLSREVEEPGLPLAGIFACAADHVAPSVPLVLCGKDLHDRRLLGHADGAALLCLGGDRRVVCVDDGGIAQSLHQGAQRSVATGGVLPPNLQLDDHQTSVVGRAKQIHLAETCVRSRSPQRKLVVEQAHSVTAGPRPSLLEAPERNRQMLLRGTAGILRLHTSIVSDEVALASGGAARSFPPQSVVLPAQGGNVDHLERICQTSSLAHQAS